eukprot:1032344-Rhodomonas_salina.1
MLHKDVLYVSDELRTCAELPRTHTVTHPRSHAHTSNHTHTHTCSLSHSHTHQEAAQSRRRLGLTGGAQEEYYREYRALGAEEEPWREEVPLAPSYAPPTTCPLCA